MADVTVVGVSGDKGSFSEEAALLYAKNNKLELKINYLIDAEGVLAALNNQQIKMGIFPLMNTSGGLVNMALDAMGKYPFEVKGELQLQINHCLLAKPGMKLTEIKNIVSHSQPLKQCQQYLKKIGFIDNLEYQDTALAAKHLAENKLPDHSAVIAPESAAKLYGLDILARNIQDANPNLTTFIIVQFRSSV